MVSEPDETRQRWTAKRRSALVLGLLKGETSAENVLRSRPRDEGALKDEQIKRLKEKVGELVLDLDILKEAAKGRPFARMTSDE